MSTTAVKRPADFVLRTLSTIFSLQNEAFERNQYSGIWTGVAANLRRRYLSARTGP
ncbi:hypothetical protein [Caballeronia terrestris]|uniref:hypothetical protein n=1 Tax=Caballeronia terrestris TaxID=1226301 RepID=UPI001F4165FD|nr:hypothetical protein [Caballeronia terrestris]